MKDRESEVGCSVPGFALRAQGVELRLHESYNLPSKTIGQRHEVIMNSTNTKEIIECQEIEDGEMKMKRKQ